MPIYHDSDSPMALRLEHEKAERLKAINLLLDKQDEIDRLRAELEALKPKPVQSVYKARVEVFGDKVSTVEGMPLPVAPNVELIFEAGKLVKAEVIG